MRTAKNFNSEPKGSKKAEERERKRKELLHLHLFIIAT